MRDLVHDNSAVGHRLKRFGLALKASPPSLSRAKLLIFLCGASVDDAPSPRRLALQRFIHSISPAHTVIYAEGIFAELVRLEHKKNILDLEHEISEIADRIIIILESESAFCELGAFAHKGLREKLIVINNSQFRNSQSFINLGPIAAASEVKSPILWYPMIWTPKKSLDGIGATFSDIKDALVLKNQRGETVQYEKLALLGMNKPSLYFVHDLVQIAGPVAHDEIVEILKKIFSDQKSFDSLKNLLGVLREGKLVSVTQASGKWVYTTVGTDLFLRYSSDIRALTAAFRTHHLRHQPERFRAA